MTLGELISKLAGLWLECTGFISVLEYNIHVLRGTGESRIWHANSIGLYHSVGNSPTYSLQVL